MPKRTCSVDDCERPEHARGWCRSHYARWLLHGDVRADQPIRVWRYDSSRCSIENCDRPLSARGWCQTHYTRWRKYGDPTFTLYNKDHDGVCAVEPCDAPVRTHGWCYNHYMRWYKRGGDPAEKRISVTNFIHGYKSKDRENDPTYRAWTNMRARCFDPNNARYEYYGGRGITIDSRWDTFQNFLDDMGERPDDPPDWDGKVSYYSLDRINNDGNYGPDNCRWATPTEQANNKRSTTSKN